MMRCDRPTTTRKAAGAHATAGTRPPTAPPTLAASVLLGALWLASGGCGKHQQPEQASEAVSVRAATARTGTLRETVQGIGTLKSVKTVEVKPEVAGIITTVGFEEGDRIEAGALLYRLDDSKLRQELQAAEAAVKAARAQRTNAEWRFERMEELRRDDMAAPEEFKELRDRVNQSRAHLDQATAKVRLIQEQLEDMRIRAPMPGAIGQTRVDVGDFVDVGQHMATLYSRSPLESEVTLPERALGRVESGQRVHVRTDAFPNRVFAGRVTFVSPSVREATRDLLVKAEIPNERGSLKPGQFVTMSITLERKHEAVLVPEETLVQTRKGYVVYVVEDGKARRRDVTIGLREPGTVEIRKGVEAGVLVVTHGQMRLRDGVEVKRAGSATQPPTTTRASTRPEPRTKPTTASTALKHLTTSRPSSREASSER